MTLPGLAFKNLSRNRFRVVLTVIGVAVAILTFMFLRTIVFAWTSAADYAAKDRVVTRHKITFVMTLPRHYAADIPAAMPEHISAVTFANWFGGKDPAHDREFFSTLAVDTKTYFNVYPELDVPHDQMEAWLANRKGAIVGDVIAKKLGWKVGDRVSLESGIFGGGAWQFDVSGIYTATARSVDRSTFLFHWEYLNDSVPERRKDQIGWIVSRVDDPKLAASISGQIDALFDVKDTQTLSQDERAFQASFLASVSALLTAIDWISVAILIIMMLILGNTIAMGVRERTNEYGVLRAMGFLPKHIAGFIVGEAMIIGLLGGALGLAMAYPLIEQGMGRWLEENMGAFFPYFRINTPTAFVALGLAMALGAVAAGIPAYRASKLKVVDALRRVA